MKQNHRKYNHVESEHFSFLKKITDEKYAILFFICLAFFVRLYRINYPLADWHSFRQVDTASVTREYVKNGIDILHPKYHDLSNVQSGSRTNIGFYRTFLISLEKYPTLHRTYHQINGIRKTITSPVTNIFLPQSEQKSEETEPTPTDLPDNVDGWRMVEFPFINAGIAVILRIFPQLPLVPTSRFVSVLFSIGTLFFLYKFVKDLSGKNVAFISALTFAVLPYSIYYSRAILPEPGMLFFSMFSIWAFNSWLQSRNKVFFLYSVTGFALALLLKPFVLFILPVYLALFLQKTKFNLLKLLSLGLFLIFSIIPLYYWRKWIQAFPSGIPASDWLYNSNGILFRPSWFYWLGYQRITKLFLGYFGLIFLMLSFIPLSLSKVKNFKIKELIKRFITSSYFILISWWLGILGYFVIIATGNVQHDYYQNLLLPLICWSVGIGSLHTHKILEKFFQNKKLLSINMSVIGVVILYVLMIQQSWGQVAGYFNVNRWDYVEAGKFVDDSTPSDAKIIAPALGDTTFLFQTNRTGWPVGSNIDQKIANGANYYVTVNYDDEARELEQKYEVVEKNKDFLLLKLIKKNEY